MLNKIVTVLCVIVAAIVVVSLFNWMGRLDEERMAAYDAYDNCVMREYNRTPSEWYSETGEYPECTPTLEDRQKTK